MKKLHSKKQNKIIVLILAVIMLCNFAMPKKANAVTTGNGGSALQPLAKLLCFIPDAVNNVLQRTLVSPANIKNVDEQGKTVDYTMLYSPGIIFSGTVPAFDINFINRDGENDEKTVFSSNKTYQVLAKGISIEEMAMKAAEILSTTCVIDNEEVNQEVIEQIDRLCNNIFAYEYIEEIIEGKQIEIYTSINGQDWNIHCFIDGEEIFRKESTDGDTIDEAINSEAGLRTVLQSKFKQSNDVLETEKKDIEDIILEQKSYFEDIINNSADTKIEKIISFTHKCNNQSVIIKIEFNANDDSKWTCYGVIATDASKTYKSSAAILQPIIASWYKALRRIALVGLLSVLVYLGIRIVLSSTSAKDKAKYKKMLKNWLEAVCLLFMLHYIMSLTINVVAGINEIIGTSVMGQNGEDVLLTKLRNQIYNAGEFAEVISQIVIYATITVYTIIFTIQYFRRTIYMAFLTAIAPLITLTYPIDKVKDSKAQAFDMWLKDYIFFSLLQVLHLLIYYIFVSQAIDLSEVGTKWSLVYSIVAIGFLTQAEKIMKKMFGFQKSKSMGALAAGATGALVMNLLNKASFGKLGKAPKGSSSSVGSGRIRTSAGISGGRTQTINPLEGLQNINLGSGMQDAQTSETSGEGNNTSTFNEDGAPVIPNSNRRSSARGRNTNSSSRTGTTSTPRTNNAITQSSNNMSGLKLFKNGNRNAINKKDSIHLGKGMWALAKRYTGPAVSKLAGLGLGGAGTLIGFSAGVAQGDIGKALTGAVAGGSAGYYGGQKLVNSGADLLLNSKDNIRNKLENIEDTFNEGARGKEYVKNQRFDRAFRASDDFKRLLEENPKAPDEYIQKMLDAGITEYKDMSKILSKNKEHPRKYSIEKAIGYSTLAKQCPYSVLNNDKKFIKFCQDREIEITPEEAKAVRKVIIEFK